MSPPPADLDLAALDSRRLDRLARGMSLARSLREWQEGVALPAMSPV
jgi:hypothetical protein